MTTSSNPVQWQRHGRIAVITIDNPPVNALSQAVREGVMDAVKKADDDTSVGAIVIACAGKTFVAGADISEFSKPPMEPHLPDVVNFVEASSKPVVAALHGTVFGGGFELALASHYRVAQAGTKVGFPEVNLGLIPGSGGTQRLPRLVGLEKSLDMITSGKPGDTESLRDDGVFDEIVAEDVTGHACRFAENLLESGGGPRRLGESSVPETGDHAAILDTWKKKLGKKARGQIAPQRAIMAIEEALKTPVAEGMKIERQYFVECRQSPQSSAMRHAFFAEREAGKLPDADSSIAPLPVKKAAVIGAGTMGSGIAMCFASAGIPVALLEMSEENLERGLETIEKRYRGSVEKNRISPDEKAERLSLIVGTCSYEDITDADLVVEAAFESTDVKKDIFGRLDRICKPEAILATNTSYLDVNKIAQATSRPERVLGMHFFSPAHIMKLLEVVRADKTDDQTMKTAMTTGKRIGKIAVPVGVCYGFVGNRMYSCYGREANSLLLEGARPAQVDEAMVSWGMAMGPLTVADMSGLDIGYKARRERPDHGSDPAYFRPADLMVDMGRLGQKTGAGFYDYDSDSGKKREDPKAIEAIRRAAAELGVKQRQISEQEIQDRLIFALINEGANILDEGIAKRPGDIDVIWLNGYGFPRYRGGPMHYADHVGLDRVLARIETFREQVGDRYWTPAPLLKTLAEKGKTFSAWSDSKSE